MSEADDTGHPECEEFGRLIAPKVDAHVRSRVAAVDARLAAVAAVADRWDGVLTECKQADPRWILDRSVTGLETARNELRAALHSDPSESTSVERGQS